MRLPKKEAQSCKTQTNAATRKADLMWLVLHKLLCVVFIADTRWYLQTLFLLNLTLHTLKDSEQRLQTPFFKT